MSLSSILSFFSLFFSIQHSLQLPEFHTPCRDLCIDFIGFGWLFLHVRLSGSIERIVMVKYTLTTTKLHAYINRMLTVGGRLQIFTGHFLENYQI